MRKDASIVCIIHIDLPTMRVIVRIYLPARAQMYEHMYAYTQNVQRIIHPSIYVRITTQQTSGIKTSARYLRRRLNRQNKTRKNIDMVATYLPLAKVPPRHNTHTFKLLYARPTVFLLYVHTRVCVYMCAMSLWYGVWFHHALDTIVHHCLIALPVIFGLCMSWCWLVVCFVFFTCIGLLCVVPKFFNSSLLLNESPINLPSTIVPERHLVLDGSGADHHLQEVVREEVSSRQENLQLQSVHVKAAVKQHEVL